MTNTSTTASCANRDQYFHCYPMHCETHLLIRPRQVDPSNVIFQLDLSSFQNTLPPLARRGARPKEKEKNLTGGCFFNFFPPLLYFRKLLNLLLWHQAVHEAVAKNLARRGRPPNVRPPRVCTPPTRHNLKVFEKFCPFAWSSGRDLSSHMNFDFF